MEEGKSFEITQTEVLLAYKRVKANKGVGGIDGIDFHTFDKEWKDRLVQRVSLNEDKNLNLFWE